MEYRELEYSAKVEEAEFSWCLPQNTHTVGAGSCPSLVIIISLEYYNTTKQASWTPGD